MYFLSAAFSGMRRRVVASILSVFGGAALLTACAALGLWAYWLNGQNDHLKAVRSASVFIDSTENAVVEEVLTKTMQTKGVETARIVGSEEFHAFLKQHFPELQEALVNLGDDVIPRMLEVVFPAELNSFARKETVSALSAIPGVMRVDDGAARLGKALSSLRWLSYAGGALCLGLWLVLFIVCLGHYQSILYTDSQEIQLIRSFGATKFAILLPWLIEAVAQSLLTALLCSVALFFGKAYLSDVYNQFFGTIGYEPFVLDLRGTLFATGIMMLMAFAAHVLAGLSALFKGRIV
jgi:cell division protein FtsX